MFEAMLAIVAYGSVVAAIVLFMRNRRSDCNQECDQGRKCDCDCTNNQDLK